jgi:hypothetical protein
MFICIIHEQISQDQIGVILWERRRTESRKSTGP